ncbi:MAG: GNAT family N-acetyltransferase [Gemmatimonadetes bacterium]|nr:GNAT family N-acetyltransferase [Gemmatimonadota bacterium]
MSSERAPGGSAASDAEQGGESGLVYRRLQTHAEYAECVALQKAIWGEEFRDPVPATMLQVSQKVGGVLIGAFDAEGRLAGFVFGITGVRDGRPVHWSHMLGVRPDMRGLGVGRRLKQLQRERLLERGVEIVQWTFDPLVARNANLNLNRLGAVVSEYVQDMYGPSLGRASGQGFGTDRFIVTWPIADERVARLLAGHAAPETVPESMFARAPVVNTESGPAGEPRLVERPLPPEPVVRIEIPTDIDGIRDRSASEAAAWRANTRRAFLHYLAGNHRVVSFRQETSSSRCFYVLAVPGSLAGR